MRSVGDDPVEVDALDLIGEVGDVILPERQAERGPIGRAARASSWQLIGSRRAAVRAFSGQIATRGLPAGTLFPLTYWAGA